MAEYRQKLRDARRQLFGRWWWLRPWNWTHRRRVLVPAAYVVTGVAGRTMEAARAASDAFERLARSVDDLVEVAKDIEDLREDAYREHTSVY